MQKPLRVLSIDGGGTRGLFPATILHEWEKETGQSVTDYFDVIVGSATGGIITLGLAAGLPIAEIAAIYRDQASFILPRNFWRRVFNPVNLFRPKYPNDNLKQLLSEKLGATTTLGDVARRYGTDTIFLTGTLDMSPDLAPGETPAFKVVVYNSAHTTDAHEKLVDLAMRTSAAAVNLPLYGRYGESGNYANDPGLIALAFCLNAQPAAPGQSLLPGGLQGLGLQAADLRFLSLGCGSDGSSYVPRKKIGTGQWGLIKWMGRLISLVIHTNMEFTQHVLQQVLAPRQFYRLSGYYKSAAAPAVLKDKKLKIDVTDREQLDAIETFAKQVFAHRREELHAFFEG